MESTDSSISSPPLIKTRPTRSSLACLPCRTKHLKCDGKRPRCSRCVGVSKECHYATSRRGGLDRAALAERRKQLAAACNTGAGDTDTDGGAEPSIFHLSTSSKSASKPSSKNTALPHDCLDSSSSLQYCVPAGYTGSSNILSFDNSISSSPSTLSMQLVDLEDDSLVRLYYDNFHIFHPCALPRRHLLCLYKDPLRQQRLFPIIAVQRLIGYLYGAREWSNQLKEHADDSLDQACPSDPFTVQARLLYSIALFWQKQLTQSKEHLEAAFRYALDLGMHRREFAIEYEQADQVLQESWRRTWWQICYIDMAFAGTTGAKSFLTLNTDPTVDLPCEESEYESGAIPQPPKTLRDFDSREFATDGGSFSSFAYLVGATRSCLLALAAVSDAGTPEASFRLSQTADSILDGWLLLLPKKKREIMRKDGGIDEMLFQANFSIHTALIVLHRPLSDLKFHVVENASSCARKPPPNMPSPDLVNVHTVRVLRSVEAQIRLLALPARPFHHSPYTTCMICKGTLALLSACRFLLRGKELAIARDQIRMTIGCLRALADIWARTAKNVQEVQVIAKHVLELGTTAEPCVGNATGSVQSAVPTLAGGEGEDNSASDTGASRDGEPAADAFDTLCGWFGPGEIGSELSLWVQCNRFLG